MNQAYENSLEVYNRQTDALIDLVARVADAADELREWWLLRTETVARLPRAAPSDRVRPIANWAGSREFANALHTWDETRVAVGDVWEQMGEEDRAQVDPPWDPYADR